MSRTCTVCGSSRRKEIDHAVVSGAPIRRIAADFGIAESSLRRHAATHLAAKFKQAFEKAELRTTTSLVDELRALTQKTGAVLARAILKKDGALALKAIARLERQLELKGRLLGELEDRDSGATEIRVTYVDARRMGAPDAAVKVIDTNSLPYPPAPCRAPEGHEGF